MGNIAQKFSSVFFTNFQHFDFQFFTGGKLFHFLCQGFHIGRYGLIDERTGFQQRNIVVDFFYPTINKPFHPVLDNDKGKCINKKKENTRKQKNPFGRIWKDHCHQQHYKYSGKKTDV